MTSVWGRSCLQKEHNSKALTGSSSHILDNVDQDHKILLKSNKPSNKPPTRPPEASAIDAVHYTEKDLQQIIQLVFQAQTSKQESFEDKFKARSSNVYCGKSDIWCYNFYQ